MNSLNQFFAGSGQGFANTIFANIISSPIGDAFQYFNIVLSIFSIFVIGKQIAARALATGETAKATGMTALAIRLAILPLFCVPAVGGKLSIAQAGVLKVAEYGSNFGDFIYSKIPNLRDSISVSFFPSSSNSTAAKLNYSADVAELVGKIYKLRYCQYRLSWLNFDYSVPPVTSRVVAGATVLNFGGPAQQRTPANICGSITLPLSLNDPENGFMSRIGNAVFSFSNSVADEILDAHKLAIQTAIGQADVALRQAFPQNEIWTPERWTQLINAMQTTAADYQSKIFSAGGVVFADGDSKSKSTILDPRFGWLGAGFSLTARSNQVAGRVSALTWRPAVSVHNVERVYPLTNFPPVYQNVDLQFNYSLQVAGLTKVATGAAAGGMGLETFLNGGDIRAAIEMMSNPYSDVFDVSASVGPLLTASAAAGLAAYAAVSVFIPGIGSFVSIALGTLAIAGQSLTVVIPLAPAIAWLFIILGWFSNVLILFCVVSFYAVSLASDETENPLSGKVAELLARALIVIFTPALLIVGLALILPAIKIGWFFVVSSIAPAVQNATSESVVASAISLILVVLIVVSLISLIVYFSLAKVASLAKSAAEILESTGGGSLSVGERVTGGESVSAAPGPVGSGARLPSPQGTPGALRLGGQTSPLAGTNGGTPGGIDRNAGHVSAVTKGSPK
jgi:hypothetical protein